MKGAGCLFTVFLLVLFAGLAALYYLGQVRPASLKPDPHRRPEIAKPTEPPEPPKPDPDRYEEWVSSLNEFHEEETPDSYRVSYGFIDHSGVTHHIECSISRSDHERETAAFGYVESEMNKESQRRMQAVLDHEVARRGIADYFTVKASPNGGYRWTSHYPGGMDEEDYAAAEARVKEMTRYLDGEYTKLAEDTLSQLYEEHGFRYRNHLITIDHGAMVLRNQMPLSDCFGALRREARGYNERQYLGLYLAFFQEIRYEIPPDVLNGKKILGLYVPTEVLVHDHGDCDSKSLAFSAMMRSMMKAVLVVDLPEHVLVAVETRPGPGQAFVQLGNRYFVLCEVAGPGKLAPGENGNRPYGSFEYTLIDPLSSDFEYGAR